MAALPAIGTFLLLFVFSHGLLQFDLGITLRIVVGAYVASLISVFVFAYIVDALAPSFGATRNLVQALKAVAYAETAMWVGALFVFVPIIGWLIALAGAIYALYLFFLGLPIVMNAPKEKAAGYAIVSIVCGIIVVVVLRAITGRFTGYGYGLGY